MSRCAPVVRSPFVRSQFVGPLLAVLLLAALLPAAPAMAANGHMLHGVGPVNSSMGGAGVALPEGAVAALHLNPALLTRIDGWQVELDVELVDASPTVASEVQTPFGTFRGKTEDETDLSVIPASGWARGVEDGGRVAFGVGFLALAGFGTDYPQDPRNPILAPQPQGFGHVFASYRFLKVPMAVGWQVNDRLALGASLNGGWATLAARPFGGAAPDCSSPTSCFYPSLHEDSAFGWGLGAGLLYQATPELALGLSYSSEMSFDEFDWNTTVANPNLPTFGTARRVEFGLDVPQMVVAGLGWTPTPEWSLALDGRWIDYESTDGFGKGVDPSTGAARGLGWDDVWAVALGVQWQATPTVALRGGYNRSKSAVPPESAFGSLAAPALFEDHLTLGLGWQAAPALTLNFAYYKIFENEVTGPFFGPAGPVPGTSVTNTMEVDSFLAGFSFDF
jgi:long-chain fatty acid transport protein